MWRVYLTPFLLPPLDLFLLAAVGVAVRRRLPRTGRALLVAAAALLVVLSVPAVGGLLLRSLEVAPPLVPPALGDRCQAIVVLGGDLRDGALEYGGATVGKLTLERVRYAAALARATDVPICASGGVLERHTEPLAELMRGVLARELGAPVRWVEARSHTTEENAAFCRELLQPLGVRRVWLVTHAWHMRRARALFLAQGFDVVPAPTMSQPALDLRATDFLPSAKALEASAFALHEWIGLAWLAVRG